MEFAAQYFAIEELQPAEWPSVEFTLVLGLIPISWFRPRNVRRKYTRLCLNSCIVFELWTERISNHIQYSTRI